jgi:osmotically-inducible protein OsmY
MALPLGFLGVVGRKGYVTLTGAVENAKQIEHATTIVKSAYGMRKVNNSLMIKK